MLLAAYDVFMIHELERAVAKSALKNHALPTDKYEFKESVLYDFIQSDFEVFSDFIDYISDPDGNDGE